MGSQQQVLSILAVAAICHEANRQYCESFGDTSQHPWAEAADWQQQSAINGVKFRLANLQAPPSASHESWMKEKEEQGWKYGERKDGEAKTHPAMVPYDDLPLEQKIKDYLFSSIVLGLYEFIQTEEEPQTELEQAHGFDAGTGQSGNFQFGDKSVPFVAGIVENSAARARAAGEAASIPETTGIEAQKQEETKIMTPTDGNEAQDTNRADAGEDRTSGATEEKPRSQADGDTGTESAESDADNNRAKSAENESDRGGSEKTAA